MMKKFIPIILSVFVALFSFGTANAQLDRSTSKVGTTAAQFLKIGAGARAIGMGGAYTGLSNDIYSLYYNPAGIATMKESGEVAFNHAAWLADISYDYAAAAFNLQDLGVVSISLTSLTMPDEKVRTFEAPEGDGRVWNANSLAMSVGFSRKLTDRFSVGLNIKYIREAIWNSSASGFAIDVGTYYITPFNNLVIGASVTNFGSKMQLNGRDVLFNDDPNGNPDTGPNNVLSQYSMDSYDLPLTFRIGLGMDIIKTRYIRLTGALDATHPNDNTEYVNSGLELAYNELFFVRVGYKSLFMRNSEEGLTLGGGVNYQFSDNMAIFFNYGWADYGRLKNVQFVDLGLKF